MTVEHAVRGFGNRLYELTSNKSVYAAVMDERAAEELGRRAAETVAAPIRWADAVGDRYDTSELGEVLGVTRQAIAARVESGSLLALAGKGTRWYPAWQIDVTIRTVRPVVRQILAAWRAIEPDVNPLVIATWARAPQQDLDGRSPVEWLSDAKDDELVVALAAATAEERSR